MALIDTDNYIDDDSVVDPRETGVGGLGGVNTTRRNSDSSDDDGGLRFTTGRERATQEWNNALQQGYGRHKSDEEINFARDFGRYTDRLERDFGNMEGLGDSRLDKKIWNEKQLEDLADTRGQFQSGFWQVTNGILKAGVLAATTFTDAMTGLATGLFNLAYQGLTGGLQGDENMSGAQKALAAFAGNPFSTALQSLNELSEKWLPNYYTNDQRDNPLALRNIVSANYIGDVLLKNMGFIVGAGAATMLTFGAGSAAIGGKAVQIAAKGMQAANTAAKTAKTASKLGQIASKAYKGATVASRDMNAAKEVMNAVKSGKSAIDGVKLTNDLIKSAARLKNSEAGLKLISTFTSAVGEGRIEAITNMKDYNDTYTQMINTEAQAKIDNIERLMLREHPEYFDDVVTELGVQKVMNQAGRDAWALEKDKIDANTQKLLNELDANTALMGNTDFLLNLPLLMFGDMVMYGKMMAGGFKAAAKNPFIKGSLEEGFKLNKGAIVRKTLGAGKSILSEGNEEMAQEFISQMAGAKQVQKLNTAYAEFYDKKLDAKANMDVAENFNKIISSAITGFNNSYGDKNQWQQFIAGAFGAMLGMPSFHRGHVNPQTGKREGGGFQLSGDLWETRREIKETRADAETTIEQLNKWAKNPRMKNLVESYIRHNALENDKVKKLRDGDMVGYKDDETSQILNLALMLDKAGRLQDMYDTIDNAANMTEDDVATIRSMVESVEGENTLSNKSDKEIIADVKKRAEKQRKDLDSYVKIAESLKTLYGGTLSGDAFNELVYNAVHATDSENRFFDVWNTIKEHINNGLQTGRVKLTDEDKAKIEKALDTPQGYIDLIQSSEKEDESARTNLIALGNMDKGYTTLVGDTNDLIMLQGNRKRFIDQYNQLLVSPGMFTVAAQEAIEKGVNASVEAQAKVLGEQDLSKLTFKKFKNIVESNPQTSRQLVNSLLKSENPVLKEFANVYKKMDRASGIFKDIFTSSPFTDEMESARIVLEDLFAISHTPEEVIRRANNIANDPKTDKKLSDTLKGLLATYDQQKGLADTVKADPQSKKKSTKKTADDKKVDKAAKKGEETTPEDRQREQEDTVGNEGNAGVEAVDEGDTDDDNIQYADDNEERPEDETQEETKEENKEEEGKSSEQNEEKKEETNKDEGNSQEENGETKQGKGKLDPTRDLIEQFESMARVDVEEIANNGDPNFPAKDQAKIRKIAREWLDSDYNKYDKSNEKGEFGDTDSNTSYTGDESRQDSQNNAKGPLAAIRGWIESLFNINGLKDKKTRVAVRRDQKSKKSFFTDNMAYNPNADFVTAMDEYGAYDYVDKGYLGDRVKKDPNLPVHLIVSDDARFNHNGKKTILLAVEADEHTTKALAVGGKQYQIVGAVNETDNDGKNGSSKIMYGLVNDEMKGHNDGQFVSKYTTRVEKIWPGRIAKSTRDVNSHEDVSQRTIGPRGRFKNLVGKMHLGVVVYDKTKPKSSKTVVTSLSNNEKAVTPNNYNTNNARGSVYLYVKGADGIYYPIATRVKRLTDLISVDYTNRDANPLMNELYEACRILVDPTASTLDRSLAKIKVKDIIYIEGYSAEQGTGYTLSFDGNSGNVRIIGNANTANGYFTEKVNDSSSIEEKAKALMEMLASPELNFRFNIKVGEINGDRSKDYMKKIFQSEILTTDSVFDHFVNSSINVAPLDQSGKIASDIAGTPSETKERSGAGNEMSNTQQSQAAFSQGNEEYRTDDGGRTFYKADDTTRTVVDDPKMISELKLNYYIRNQLEDENARNALKQMEVTVNGHKYYLAGYSDGDGTSHKFVMNSQGKIVTGKEERIVVAQHEAALRHEEVAAAINALNEMSKEVDQAALPVGQDITDAAQTTKQEKNAAVNKKQSNKKPNKKNKVESGSLFADDDKAADTPVLGGGKEDVLGVLINDERVAEAMRDLDLDDDPEALRKYLERQNLDPKSYQTVDELLCALNSCG